MILLTETQVGKETPLAGIGFLVLKTFDASSSINASVDWHNSMTLTPSTAFEIKLSVAFLTMSADTLYLDNVNDK